MPGNSVSVTFTRQAQKFIIQTNKPPKKTDGPNARPPKLILVALALAVPIGVMTVSWFKYIDGNYIT